MKMMTVLGSPRKKGNTAKVLEFFEELVGKEHKVERINIVSHDVRGCLGCLKCQEKMDEPGCAQKDDTPDLLQRLLASDVVIYATPLYTCSYSAQMKAFIDRLYCLVKFVGISDNGVPETKSLVEGKRVALLVTCSGPVENNADLIQEQFARLSGFAKTESMGSYVIPFCTTPDQMGERAQEVALKMAGDIAGIGA
jgi:FMN-dependent NADH-azoreductase